MPNFCSRQSATSGRKPEHGYVLLVTLVILAAVMTLGIAMMSKATAGKRSVTSSKNATQSRYAAESAIALIINKAANSVDSNGYLLEMPPTDFTIHNHQATVGMEVELNENGDNRVDTIRGKYDLMTFRSYANIDASAENPNSGSVARIRQRVAFDQYPLFQFAIYWEGIMLLDPGSSMAINGRVHCNSKVRLFPWVNLSLEDWFTSPCVISHMQSGGSSKIRIKRLDGILTSYRTPPVSEVAIDTPLYGSTKRVRFAMGSQVSIFKVPVGTNNSAIIIQPKGVNDLGVGGFTEGVNSKRQKFVYKADLIFRKRDASGAVVKNWYRNQADGSDIAVPSSDRTSFNTAIDTLPHASNRPDSLYDFGERKWMNATYVNMGNFFTASTSAADQILYLEGQFDTTATPNKRDVFVLWNARTLGRNFTVVSNCPVYIFGSYNNVATKNAAVVADIVTQLSKNWRGSYGPSTVTKNGANDTLMACILGGVLRARIDPTWNNPTNANYYNWNQVDNASFSDRVGQPHNHMSFLENWTGFTYTYSGSQVALWRCLKLNGFFRWNPGNSIYVQPTRNYSFDTRYNNVKNMPPGTPVVISPFNLDYYEVHEE